MQTDSSSSSTQLINEQRLAILQALLENYQEGKLKHCTINQIADKFSVSTNCVGKVWKHTKESMEEGRTYMDVGSCKTNCGCKRKAIKIQEIVKVPFRKRGTIRSTAEALQIPKSILLCNIQ